MKQRGTVKIHMLSEALSPITHMMGVSGNESIINREKVFHDGKVKDIPVLSGNALRHKMIREPGAMYLVNQLDMRGKLSIDQANYMFTGGSLSESSTNDNIPLIADMQRFSPLFRLLGGSLKNQVIGGSLFVSRGVLCCEENQDIIQKQIGNYKVPEDKLFPAQYFIDKYQYTRGEAGRMKDAPEMIKNIDDQIKTNLMIYAGESVIPGALFYHNLTLYNVSPLEVGAALHSLGLWQNSGGTIGGSARIGHGKLKIDYWLDGLVDWFGSEKDPAELVKDYINHVTENRENFKGWLKKAFPTKEELLL
ncbi:hypothetical protein KA005_57990 [bacterium]|nr:hypothetical protein [bacterium]